MNSHPMRAECNDLARQIVAKILDHEETGLLELAARFKEEDVRPEHHDFICEQAAEKWESEGELEIDDGALVSESEDQSGVIGAYVQAWVWIDLPKPEGEDDAEE